MSFREAPVRSWTSRSVAPAKLCDTKLTTELQTRPLRVEDYVTVTLTATLLPTLSDIVILQLPLPTDVTLNDDLERP